MMAIILIFLLKNYELSAEINDTTENTESKPAQIKPKLLVLYHTLFWGSSAEEIINEVKEKYDGEVILARDLDIF